MKMRNQQQGFLLIEGLIAILIFSLGVLGLVAMGSKAIAAQSDAQYRTFAAQLADEIAGKIAVGVDRTNDGVNIPTSLAAYQHLPSGTCVAGLSGAASTNAEVTAWVARASTPGPGLPGLPGAATASQQIKVPAGSMNEVDITVCWQAPSDTAPRQLTLVTYVN
jgi:type IV pilus assembly protein PilV